MALAATALGPTLSGLARKLPTWPVYVLGLVPGGVVAWNGVTAVADGVDVLLHGFGELGLQFLLASLVVTPLLRFARINLVKFRKALGLLSVLYLSLHFAVWLLLDLQLRWGLIGSEIVKRPYLTIGFAAFVMLLPLAATSWQGAMRRLGAAGWARLHRLVYPAVILGGIHHVMQEKVWLTEALVYLAAALLLVGLRGLWIRRW
ncbi:sulfite oxidase heme-binding subunit YedZ [Jannaschia formosa]|uniref:sulfite oxidase heme-binding subunit YedZ n=1 Tax=Jannaschia formosa TaxID=2259592 RepID=UPI000E1C1BA4|nr:protein-methionine-sulfoxide reductase heme-binding subunit MsrQ [Jannaschia formosa]TFL19179.1 sulfoxide reductase heme-binding subunit YedZ [Jannaschia formosa]